MLTLAIVLASFNCIAQDATHSDYLGAGHMTGVTVTTSGTGFFG